MSSKSSLKAGNGNKQLCRKQRRKGKRYPDTSSAQLKSLRHVPSTLLLMTSCYRCYKYRILTSSRRTGYRYELLRRHHITVTVLKLHDFLTIFVIWKIFRDKKKTRSIELHVNNLYIIEYGQNDDIKFQPERHSFGVTNEEGLLSTQLLNLIHSEVSHFC